MSEKEESVFMNDTIWEENKGTAEDAVRESDGRLMQTPRNEAATRYFGPYGMGWGVENLEYGKDEREAWLDADFWYVVNGEKKSFPLGVSTNHVNENGVKQGLRTILQNLALKLLGFNSEHNKQWERAESRAEGSEVSIGEGEWDSGRAEPVAQESAFIPEEEKKGSGKALVQFGEDGEETVEWVNICRDLASYGSDKEFFMDVLKKEYDITEEQEQYLINHKPLMVQASTVYEKTLKAIRAGEVELEEVEKYYQIPEELREFLEKQGPECQ